MATTSSIRNSVKESHLGYLDALLEKKNVITSLSLEELAKIAILNRAAINNCCPGTTGLALEEEYAQPVIRK